MQSVKLHLSFTETQWVSGKTVRLFSTGSYYNFNISSFLLPWLPFAAVSCEHFLPLLKEVQEGLLS